MSNVTKEKVKKTLNSVLIYSLHFVVNLYDFLSSVEQRNVWMKIDETIKVNGEIF